MYEDECTNKGGMALFNMTSNPSYVAASEVVSTCFAPGTKEDKEVDYTYEVLPRLLRKAARALHRVGRGMLQMMGRRAL